MQRKAKFTCLPTLNLKEITFRYFLQSLKCEEQQVMILTHFKKETAVIHRMSMLVCSMVCMSELPVSAVFVLTAHGRSVGVTYLWSYGPRYGASELKAHT
jgi:hypothetical protein